MRHPHHTDPAHQTTPNLAHRPASVSRTALRTRAGLLLDTPFANAEATWASTLWPDDCAPGGWARTLWGPQAFPSRGWALPALLALGDIVEFGAIAAGVDRRWWGIVDTYEPDAWLTLLGPIAGPTDALDLSRALLASEQPQPLTVAADRPGPRATQRQRKRRCHR